MCGHPGVGPRIGHQTLELSRVALSCWPPCTRVFKKTNCTSHVEDSGGIRSSSAGSELDEDLKKCIRPSLAEWALHGNQENYTSDLADRLASWPQNGPGWTCIGLDRLRDASRVELQGRVTALNSGCHGSTRKVRFRR